MLLTRIDSAEENAFVYSLALKHLGSSFPYIGAESVVAEGTWMWSDGTRFWSGGSNGSAINGLYANWKKGRPSGSANCVALEASTGEWMDYSCGITTSWICESR
jgi:hypothetical protein